MGAFPTQFDGCGSKLKTPIPMDDQHFPNHTYKRQIISIHLSIYLNLCESICMYIYTYIHIYIYIIHTYPFYPYDIWRGVEATQQPKASFDPIAAKSSSPAADPYNNLGTWAVEFVEPHGKILENHL